MRSIIVFVLCLLILILHGCQCSRQPKPIDEEHLQFPDYITNECHTLPAFSSQCKIQFDDLAKKIITLNGSIAILPDSVFVFRANLFGLMEVARGAIYNDHFIMLNIAERTAYCGKNTYLESIFGFPITPKTLMLLFTGDFCEEIFNNQLHFVTTSKTPTLRSVESKHTGSKIEINFSDNKDVSSIIANPYGKTDIALHVDYNTYEAISDSTRLPHQMRLTLQHPSFFGTLCFDYKNITLTNIAIPNISLPSKYKVIELK